MTALDLDAIAARYSAALNAKPSKGEWTQRGIDALTDSVSDVGELLDEVERLRLVREEWGRLYNRSEAERDRLRAAVDAVRGVATHCDFDCGCTECMMARAVLAALDEHLGGDRG